MRQLLVSWNSDLVAYVPERGARLARRDDRAYWAYLREEQRREPGPAPPGNYVTNHCFRTLAESSMDCASHARPDDF